MVRSTGTKMWVWGAVAALTIGMVGFGGPATAAQPAPSNAPAATASAKPAGYSVTITSTINRAVTPGNPTVTCTLASTALGGTTLLDDCGAATSTKKLTTYARTIPGLAAGEYTLVVTFTLSDGGTATATAHFTILGLREACAAQRDAYQASLMESVPNRPDIEWTCFSKFPLLATALAALSPYCSGAATQVFSSDVTCYKPL